MKPELDNKLMMVVTRGQTGGDGPVTPTSSTAAPVCHNATVTTASDARSAGRCGECAASTDPTARAAGGTQTSQAGMNIRSTQIGPTLRSGLPWLPTDDESGTEPEDPYSQGDRLDGWEQTVGGVVGGNRRVVPPRVLLVEDAECHEGTVLDPSSLHVCEEPRLFRERAHVTNASSGVTAYGADRNCTADCGEHETDGYITRDPWYTQSQSDLAQRQCGDIVRQCPEMYPSRSDPMLLRLQRKMPFMGPDVNQSFWMPQTSHYGGKDYWLMEKDYGGKK